MKVALGHRYQLIATYPITSYMELYLAPSFIHSIRLLHKLRENDRELLIYYLNSKKLVIFMKSSQVV